MEIDSNNPVVKLCAEGIAAERAGRVAEAAALYQQAWQAQTNDYEACIVAHYVAHVQSTPQESLHWNQEALRHADAADRDKVQAFYPSLYLNVGKAHEDLGSAAEAKRSYELAADRAANLPAGKLTDMVRRGVAEGLKRVSA
jgi:tetratricopeptide (TPR) repeat protein